MTNNKKPKLVCGYDMKAAGGALAALRKVFDITCIEPTEDALREQLPGTDAYYASLEVRIARDLLELAPRLRAIATPSTGTDHIDLHAAAERDIAVLSLKDDRQLLDGITATAELAWGLLLACARRIPAASRAAQNGLWGRDLFRGHQIAYKTLGIVGCGRLGSIVAQYANAFRMKVIGYDPHVDVVPGVEMVCFEELLRRADVISIHVHLTEKTRGLIGYGELAAMKPDAVLINTSRGAVIDEEALLQALASGYLAGAGLDIIDGEWQSDLETHPVLTYARLHDNLIVTPHIGGVTYESQSAAFLATANKLIDFFASPNTHKKNHGPNTIQTTLRK